MRIAFINTRSDAVGGSQIHVQHLSLALMRQGHDVRVFLGGHGRVTDALEASGVPFSSVTHLVRQVAPLTDFWGFCELRAALKAFRPDLVSTHTSKAGLLGRLAARSLGIPATFTAHGWSFTEGISAPARRLCAIIERSIAPLTAKIITVSEYDRRLALQYGIASPRQLVAIHNGVPDLAGDRRAEPWRARPRIVMVARFEPQKDHATLLEALSGLGHLDWELEFIGGGPLEAAGRSLCEALAISDRVTFLGPRADVAARLAHSQIFALITRWEGLPRSILEAMRAGLPVIASDVGGVAEQVLDGRTGYRVGRGDVAGVRSRLSELIASSELRTRMGHAGRKHYEQNFTFARMFERTIEVYQGLVSKPGFWGTLNDDMHELGEILR